MTLKDIDRESVEFALVEFDELGRAEFLRKYGFGVATTYLLRQGNSFYDPKAIIGAAHGYVAGSAPLAPSEFDATEAIARLRTLGFEIVDFNGLWWVNQGSTYKAEQRGDYVWAPKVTKGGRSVAHHTAVLDLRPGQKTIHYVDGKIRAIGTVVADPESRSKPAELRSDEWIDDGNWCRVSYHELDEPVARADVPNRDPAVGPFDVNGGVKQGYLFRVANEQALPILSFLAERVPEFFDPPHEVDDIPAADPPTLPAETDPIHELLLAFKNVVLEGVPGTGKSYAIERLAANWEARTGRQLLKHGDHHFAALVMHPSTSYEDFIEGLRPTTVTTDDSAVRYFDQEAGTGGSFAVGDGFFLGVCAEAASRPDQDVLVLLDELNRCNVSSVFGDLLLALEASRRGRFRGTTNRTTRARDWHSTVPVRLPYSRRLFFVPDNVYVVATANTTDRSVAPLDAAIRRRFAFHRLEPEFGEVTATASELGTRADLFIHSTSMMRQLNSLVLGPCLGPDAMLGQSYLYAMHSLLKASGDQSTAIVARCWRFSILPQLVDGLATYGAEALLDKHTRDLWFLEHGAELPTDVTSATGALDRLDTFLDTLGLSIVVEGTGLSRGARIVESSRVDEALPATPDS